MAQTKFRVLMLFLALFALGSILLAACVRPGTASTSSATPSPAPSSSNSCPTGNTVTTGPSNFEQSCIGPFATAGTYHIYCTVHTGMNLTVSVK